MKNSQQRLAEFVSHFPSVLIEEKARHVARQSLLDTLVVAFAGRNEHASQLAMGYIGSMRQPDGAIGWLTGERYFPEAAALCNAVAAHVLDYDDVTPAWRGHPSAVIWPALCAVGVQSQATFGEMIDSYVLGFEVGAQIGATVTAHHYTAGWHSTSTIGVIAATAACSRAFRLDSKQTSNALGLAVAQSAGVQSNFGSMAKPFQAGLAASAAVRATQLARAGAQASEDALEGSAGFSGLFGDKKTIKLALPGRPESLMAIVQYGIEVKQFPNCYATHRAIEAALSLRPQVIGVIDQVTAVRVEGSPGAHKPLKFGMPETVNEARFSVEFGVACALIDGGVQLGSFTDDALTRPEIRKLVSNTHVQETQDLGATRAARVTVEVMNGAPRIQTISSLTSCFDELVGMQRLAQKVDGCMAEAGLGPYAQPLLDEILVASPSGNFHFMDTAVFKSIFSAMQYARRP